MGLKTIFFPLLRLVGKLHNTGQKVTTLCPERDHVLNDRGISYEVVSGNEVLRVLGP